MGLRIDPALHSEEEPVEWLLNRLTHGRTVRSWVPSGFESYARILHPARGPSGPVPWGEVSTWSGKPLHRTASIDDLARRADGSTWQDQGMGLPLEGQLEPPYLDRLCGMLAVATATPEELWLLVWHGRGGTGTAYSRESVAAMRRPPQRFRHFLDARRQSRITGSTQGAEAEVEISPSLSASGRRYVLHAGAIDGLVGDDNRSVFEDPPNFWWPGDRAWFISTDIDSTSTYVAGSSALVGQLLTDDLLGVFPAYLDDPYDGAPPDLETEQAL